MAGFSLGGGGDNRFGETLIFAHAVGQFHATNFSAAIFVGAPSTAGEVAANNHFHGKGFTFPSHGHHGVGRSQFPVGHNVGSGIQKRSRDLVEHLSLGWDTFREHHIESRDAVGGNHHQNVVANAVHIAHFAVIHCSLSFKIKVGVN